MSSANFGNLYKESVNSCEKWFSRSSEAWMFERPRKEIGEYLLDPDLPYGPLTALGQLAAWSARKACLSISKGDVAGWGMMLNYFHIHCNCLKIELEGARILGARAPKQVDPTLKPFHLLAMAMAMRQHAWIDWLGERVVAARSSGIFGKSWDGTRIDPFRSYLCAIYMIGKEVDIYSEHFGPYESILKNWNNLSECGDAINLACDHHVEQIALRKPDEIAVFENNPHDIFPSEILALYRVREKLGLPSPNVNHPLLKTPFCEVPEQIECAYDPLVEQALALAYQRLPEAMSKMR